MSAVYIKQTIYLTELLNEKFSLNCFLMIVQQREIYHSARDVCTLLIIIDECYICTVYCKVSFAITGK